MFLQCARDFRVIAMRGLYRVGLSLSRPVACLTALNVILAGNFQGRVGCFKKLGGFRLVAGLAFFDARVVARLGRGPRTAASTRRPFPRFGSLYTEGHSRCPLEVTREQEPPCTPWCCD